MSEIQDYINTLTYQEKLKIRDERDAWEKTGQVSDDSILRAYAMRSELTSPLSIHMAMMKLATEVDRYFADRYIGIQHIFREMYG